MVVTKRASIGGATSFSVGLHTDQQSLILGEMMTARNKLQQENQMLRDKLQDSEMMVRLLQHKLSEHKIEVDFTKECGIAVDDFPILTQKVNRKPMEKLKSNLNKNAFRNQVAPGKKTFESKAIKLSTAAGMITKFNVPKLPQSPKSRSAKLQTMSCSPDSRFAEPEETRPATTTNESKSRLQQHHTKTRRSSVASSISKNGGKCTKSINNNNHVHCFGEEQFPGDAHQMRSVIGKLAQVVINEYSTTDDDDENIIFE